MPLSPVVEFLAMCDATRRDMPASDIHCHDEYVTGFRKNLVETYELDLTDPRIIAAVAAGVVEGMAAAIEHTPSGTSTAGVAHGALACGWALYDLALPHLAPVQS